MKTTLCQLITDPQRFSGKLVRFRAVIYQSMPDSSGLYSPKCRAIRATFDILAADPDPTQNKLLLDRIWNAGITYPMISEFNQAEVTFIARFEIPPSVSSQTDYPDYILRVRKIRDIRQIPDDQSSWLTDPVDVEPCGRIRRSKMVKMLAPQVVGYLTYDGGRLVSVRVRPTCRYQETGMRPIGDYRLMSSRSMDMLLRRVDRLRTLGTFQNDDPVAMVYSPVVQRTQHYSHAEVVRYTLSCRAAESKDDCGVIKFDVNYLAR